MLSTVEGVGCSLVNGYSDGFGGWIRGEAAVYGDGFQFHLQVLNDNVGLPAAFARIRLIPLPGSLSKESPRL